MTNKTCDSSGKLMWSVFFGAHPIIFCPVNGWHDLLCDRDSEGEGEMNRTDKSINITNTRCINFLGYSKF